jgi:hypothetical protein
MIPLIYEQPHSRKMPNALSPSTLLLDWLNTRLGNIELGGLHLDADPDHLVRLGGGKVVDIEREVERERSALLQGGLMRSGPPVVARFNQIESRGA